MTTEDMVNYDRRSPNYNKLPVRYTRRVRAPLRPRNSVPAARSRDRGPGRRLVVPQADRPFRCRIVLALLLIPPPRRAAAIWRSVAGGPSRRAARRSSSGCGACTTSARYRGREANGSGPLIDQRPFAFVRNPLYIGNITAVAGVRASARGCRGWRRSSSSLLALEYHAIVRWEEAPARIAARRQPTASTRRACRAGFQPSTTTSQSAQRSGTHGTRAERSHGARRSTANAERSSPSRSGYLLLWLKAQAKSQTFQVLRPETSAFGLRSSDFATDTSDATDRYGRQASPIFSSLLASGRLRRP